VFDLIKVKTAGLVLSIYHTGTKPDLVLANLPCPLVCECSSSRALHNCWIGYYIYICVTISFGINNSPLWSFDVGDYGFEKLDHDILGKN
jgi:hypothetical protein